jgi:hypothetical protein
LILSKTLYFEIMSFINDHLDRIFRWYWPPDSWIGWHPIPLQISISCVLDLSLHLKKCFDKVSTVILDLASWCLLVRLRFPLDCPMSLSLVV